MSAARSRPDPWWSSDGDDVDPDQDPLTAHLSARGLGGDDPADDPDGPTTGERSNPADDRASTDGGTGRPGEPDGDPAGTGHPPGICAVCPICRGHATLRDHQPEVAAHLADAARSLSLALDRFADLVGRPGDRDHHARDRHRGDHDDATTRRPGSAERAGNADGGFTSIAVDDETGGRP